MPYTAVTWADSPATTSPLDAANLNHLESQYLEATNSFEQDLFTPFVYGATSFLATKDGTNASQLDVTSGVAFLLQTDGTLRRRALTSSTQSTSGHPSTTLFLDLNPDGTWSWGTSHSGVSGHLTIASVTTDSSAHIATVTDARTLSTTLLSGMAGTLGLPAASIAGSLTVAGQIMSNVPAALASAYIWSGAVGAGALVMLDIRPTDAGQPHWQLIYNGSDQHFQIQNATGGIDALDIDTSGNALIHGSLSEVNGRVAVQGTHSAGQPALSYGSGVPGALGSNEIYFQVS